MVRQYMNGLQGVARATGPLLLIAATLWVVRYWHSSHFGFYEDDYTRTPAAALMGSEDLVDTAITSFKILADHGKPLHGPFIYAFSIIGWRLGGLTYLYVISYLVVLTNALLLFALIRRLAGQSAAVLGALVFCVYPSDTTQAFLTHGFGLHPSLAFFLLACHAYVSGKPLISYLLLSLVLLTYETPFLMFLALPLFAASWNRSLRRKALCNAIILGLILGVVTLLRLLAGESRVEGLSLASLAVKPLTNLVVGPVINLALFGYRLAQVIQGWDMEIAAVTAVLLLAFLVTFSRLPRDVTNLDGQTLTSFGDLKGDSIVQSLRNRRWPVSLPAPARKRVQLMAGSLMMIAFSYPITFTVRAYSIRGRDTRVHFAAAVGAAILLACLSESWLQYCRQKGKPLLGSASLAVYLALLGGFGFIVQRDYARAWQLQRDFWTQVVWLAPDLADGTAVLVDPAGLEEPRQISANTWNLPRILSQIYRFPDDWREPPRVFRLTPGWEGSILAGGHFLRLDASTTMAPPSLYREVYGQNVILLTSSDGQLARHTEKLDLDGSPLMLKVRSEATLGDLPKGILYDLLIKSAVY